MSSMKTTKVIYTDGTTEELTVTMFEQIMATRYLKNNNLGTVAEEPVTFAAYQVYAKLRQEGKLNEPFEQWVRSVVQVEDIKHEDAETLETVNSPVDMDTQDAPGFSTNGTAEASAN
ncbi:hypothetical protein BISA_1922 [Bifidobacterium saguini DSM 23967]|uniref:Uncharacterized protein n=2 Tax=Bifidobacterium saguini TaxID=762210 RepID=A0A087D5Z3_9BIFI|nr:hypothetical protein [Bifidobacterium saguini]KFI90943.1 hypothetical protein BISA_1922 [Bifidobacterium saguini DSM 23967]QTB91434.1 hypothetical protein BSD967_03155 [Bifidobacterium saguini]